MFMLVGVLIRLTVLAAVVTIRLAYWGLRALILLVVAIAATVSTSYGSRRSAHD
jgi:hypothetical protein